MLFSRKTKQPLTRDQVSGPNLSIGNHTYGEPTILTFDQTTHLSIGRFCSISDKVTIILGGNHRTDWLTTYPFPAFARTWPEASDIEGHPSSKGDISIGNDIWIGYGTTILSGVTIGNGAVIGAESVVTDDVSPYTIVAGNPAREKKNALTRTPSRHCSSWHGGTGLKKKSERISLSCAAIKSNSFWSRHEHPSL